MGVKVAATCLHWSQSAIVPQSPSSSSQTLASAISSPSSKRRRSITTSFTTRSEVTRHVQRLDRSALFRPGLLGTGSFDSPRPRTRPVKRTCSASSDSFEFDLPNNDNDDDDDNAVNSGDEENNSFAVDPPWQEPPDWCESIERKANSVELPLSLRIIKRKLQWRDGFREAGESAYCSVKKAFSSMVFIIRELQSFMLQMREVLFYEDLQGILVRVQKEMHASFVWLFQQVFSHTPTLMVYVMILLANFTVHSMSSNAAIAAPPPPPACHSSIVEIEDNKNNLNFDFDSSSIKTFSVSSGKTTSIGGGIGGGGKIRPVASGTDGDGGFDRFDQFRRYVPDAAGAGSGSQLSSVGTGREAESVSGQVEREEEVTLWNSIVDEASNMQASIRDGTLDHETMKRLVSPVFAKIESDAYTDYFKTEILYRTGLAQEPNNSLLLANYAQFLYLVEHDYDRAEEYFKRAIGVEVEAADAEAYNKYARFLWRVKKDLWAAEETFLEAISADPTNSYYAADYAHFLWNTGGDDTCFPLSSPDTTDEA